MNKIKSQTLKESRVAIFIDAANFEISLKSSGLSSNYRKLLDWAGKDGKVLNGKVLI